MVDSYNIDAADLVMAVVHRNLLSVAALVAVALSAMLFVGCGTSQSPSASQSLAGQTPLVVAIDTSGSAARHMDSYRDILLQAAQVCIVKNRKLQVYLFDAEVRCAFEAQVPSSPEVVNDCTKDYIANPIAPRQGTRPNELFKVISAGSGKSMDLLVLTDGGCEAEVDRRELQQIVSTSVGSQFRRVGVFGLRLEAKRFWKDVFRSSKLDVTFGTMEEAKEGLAVFLTDGPGGK